MAINKKKRCIISNIEIIKQQIQTHIDTNEYGEAIKILSELLKDEQLPDEDKIWALRLRAHCYSWCAGMDEEETAQLPEAEDSDEDVELALADLDAVLAMDSLTDAQRVEVLFERITELRWMFAYEQASNDCLRILETVGAKFADKINAYYTLADLNMCLDKPFDAADNLTKILENDEIPLPLKAEVLEFRAEVRTQAGQMYEAIDDLEAALDIFKRMEHAAGIMRLAQKIQSCSNMT